MLKITDEALFASSQYAAYLTDLAEAASKRYKRRIKVKTYWDDQENAPAAWTDNRVITVNAGNYVTQSFPTRRLRADSMVGMTGHEIGHVLFTDFTMLAVYNEALKAGRFYPAEPTELTFEEQLALDEYRTLINGGDQAAVKAVCRAAGTISNILEDIHIEAQMREAFPGSYRTGILLNSLRIVETAPTLGEQVQKGYMSFSIMCNLMLQYCRSGEINNLTGYTGEYLDALTNCLALIDDAVYDNDARVRYDATNHIILRWWKYVKELIEQYRKQPDETDDAVSKQTGGTEAPSGKGKAVSQHFKHDPTAEEKDKHTIEQVIAEETGRIELEKTDGFDEGSNPGMTYNGDYAGAGYTSTEADMNRILSSIAEAHIEANMEDELTAELQAEADRIDYGNAHRGIHVTVNRIAQPGDTLIQSYANVAPPLLLLSKRVQSKVEDLLKTRREGGKMTDLLIGRRINARAFARDDGKIFYNNLLPQEQMDLAVGLLIDESGSMSSCDRITYARSAAIVLYDFCMKLGIPVIVYGHTSYSADVDMYAYAEFDSQDKKDAFRMMDMSSRSGNRDGAALRFVAERMMSRDESTKLLILISDGQPASSDYYGTAAEADLRGIKKEYQNKGITLFAAAIGDDKPNIERIYGDGFLDITDLTKLPMNLTRLISRYIRG
jgi:hypothetical protein